MHIQHTYSSAPSQHPRRSDIWYKTWYKSNRKELLSARCGQVFKAEEAASAEAYRTKKHSLWGSLEEVQYGCHVEQEVEKKVGSKQC